ncbi:ribonuclease HIII [Enterococcus caccae]|uniref:Ribonuclease HIII n=1 Tax=Enterococcus caccae ATCC BAA-1240 TaxID=1158612 RepID=R3WDM0_9ENTE|nr:ribonuclease HIII [Enterococcus caccae]EOL45956.1 ribonuclease HIII [Enterococcus caccae ATCC BAA-1240]EOT61152.1 ribonuclease HIII [Enterococcus caccae ATCC BAA-1240]OJG27817.1 ribonuclease HIII [Enterococcus caccae]
MSQTQVIKVTKDTMKKMKSYYEKNRLNRNVPYSDFVAKVGNTTITAYTSGKIVFQGPDAEKIAAKWGPIQNSNAISSSKNSSVLPANFSQLSVLGSDEVGNGSYFGPVTVCAAYVDKTMVAKLKALGVRDSKELTDPQIVQLSSVIKELIPYKLLIVEPEKYNRIQPKYNAVHMKVALHNQAIYLLLNEIAPTKPEAILIDQFTPETNYKKYVRSEQNQVREKLTFITKGEQYHVAVAAASIISRAAFLEELEKESKELGMKVPSGAGATSDKVAAAVLAKGGMSLLSKYVKLHFANTEKAKKIATK